MINNIEAVNRSSKVSAVTLKRYHCAVLGEQSPLNEVACMQTGTYFSSE